MSLHKRDLYLHQLQSRPLLIPQATFTSNPQTLAVGAELDLIAGTWAPNLSVSKTYQIKYTKTQPTLDGVVSNDQQLQTLVLDYNTLARDNGIYNAAFECLTINKLAQNIQKKIQAKLVYFKSNDIRSYRLNSDKLTKVGFAPKYFIKDAINEIIDLHSKKLLKEEINNYNLKKMKKLNMLLSK